MTIHRQTRHFTAWLTCLAVLLALLGQSGSHIRTVAGEAGSYWTEICSVQGRKVVKVTMDHAPASPVEKSNASSAQHCALCLTQADTIGLLATVAGRIPVVSGSSLFPALFYHSPHPLFAWASPPSRAPPAHS